MYNSYFTSDPIRDAETYASREDTRPIIDRCPVCGEPVHGENDDYEKDDAYKIDGWVVHEDCVLKFLKKEGYKI